MPLSATYKYKLRYNQASATDNPQTCECSATCQIYKFSQPDAYGAMALCYFTDRGNMKYVVNDIDEHGYELSTQHLVDRMIDVDNGEWQSIHVRYLKPNL